MTDLARPHVAIAVLAGTTGGPATYGRRLVQALAASGEVQLSVLTDRPAAFLDAANNRDATTHDRVPPASRNLDSAIDIIDVPMRGGIDRLRWQHWAVPKVLRKLRPDVYHDTKNALPARLRCPSVVTVHDLAYYTVPETFGWASRMFLRQATRAAVRRAQIIVVPSQATANDLTNCYPASAQRTHVVPHGIDPAASIPSIQAEQAAARLGLPEPYVLHVGTIQARKNVDLVIAGVRQLRARGLPHRALIIGRRGWLSERAITEIERDDTAFWIEHVSADDLAVCYARAKAFVSPSAYEGFGFAVADALAAGVPTAIANISSLPELCGDAAVHLRELSSDAVAEALHTLLTDEPRSRKLSALGQKRAATFSWQACADGHLRAYHTARA